jgi:hypothetical protein
MKIHAIKTKPSPPPFDLEAFSTELREISNRYGARLVSLGAMATADGGNPGKMYLAVWSVESDDNQGN